MGTTETFRLDAVLDLSNRAYQQELEALFKSCAVYPVIVDEEKLNLSAAFRHIAEQGGRHCMYITDNIDASKLAEARQMGLARLDNVLMVDDESKQKVSDSPALTMFNHVLSCNQQHVPHLQIMSMVRKIRDGKFFGVDKCVAYGAYVHRYILSHSDQRQWFRDALYEFVKGLSSFLNRPSDMYAQYAVEVQEELLMNAIWDANPNRRTVDRRVPVALLPQEAVQVEWSFDGTTLAIGVRDPFGTFEAPIIYKYLKFLFANDRKSMIKMQQEAAGAGLGLFMVLERLSGLIVNVSPGQCTEVVAALNLLGGPKAFNKRQRSFQYFSI
jgi:hypothetical protein